MWRFDEAPRFRDSQLSARFLLFDSKLAAAALLVVVHFRLWTVVVMALMMIIFTWVEWRGMRIENAIRRVRSVCAGRLRHARGPSMSRPVSDMIWQAGLESARPSVPDAPSEEEGQEAAPAPGRSGLLKRLTGGRAARKRPRAEAAT